MQDNDESLLNVVHSLPVLSYSVALAQRTPTAGFNQPTKYMPDYGGYLETATSCLKNNALNSRIPFCTKPDKVQIKFAASGEGTTDSVTSSNNCLIVDSYLSSDSSNDQSVIRLLGSNVTFDSLSRVSAESYDTTRYGKISSKHRIPTGLKYTNSHNTYLLVKFSKSIKIYELDRSVNLCYLKQEGHTTDRPIHEHLASVSERAGYDVRDASLNPRSSSILGVASDNSNVHSIKLFDLSSSSRLPIQSIEWATLGNEFPSTDTCMLSKQLRGRIVRTFIPIRPTNWGTQQLDHLPSHLFNLLVTNEHKISLVDPRSNTLVRDYITKAELPSFYPIEYMRRTIFSKKNDYQFYSMTNVHVRVIDTRYPGVPVAQVSHMLGSETYNSMDMRSIEYPFNGSETLCCSSLSRLSFTTFDQSELESLVNPKSTHLPFHDSGFFENYADGDLPAFGLSAVGAKSHDQLFSIFQLSLKGDLLVRSYGVPNEKDIDGTTERVNLGEDEALIDRHTLVPIRQTDEMPDRLILNPGQITDDNVDLIDLLDSSFLDETENKLESKRAQEKFELMRNKLSKA